MAFVALAAAHHERCLRDPELNHAFSHPGNPAHVENLAAYWIEVFGGPPRYSSELGGQSGMIGIHAGQGVGEGWDERFVECFVGAFDDAGLPDDPDLRAALRAYMEWAVGDVLAYSPPGSHVPNGLEVPRWTWDGLQSSPRARHLLM